MYGNRIDAPLEVLYELAMAIGNSTDLEENLRESLGAYLQKLHCSGGAVFTTPATTKGEEGAEGNRVIPVASIPRYATLAKNEGYHAALKYPGWTAEGLPSKGSIGLDFFYHWFELPQYGYLLLLRSHQPLSTPMQNALLDINNKLAISARACRSNAAYMHLSRHLLRNVLDTIPVRVFWKDKDLKYLGCNAPFARDAGFFSVDDVIGRSDEAMAWTAQMESYRADDRRVLETGESLLMYEERQNRSDGDLRWLRTSKTPLRDYNGEILGVLGVYEDITEEKGAREKIRKQLKEKESLLAEVHHRVFNNLSVISGLLSVQAARIDSDEGARSVLVDTRMRIESMGLVYRNLYRAGDLEMVNMDAYCREIASHLKQRYAEMQSVRIVVDANPVDVSLEKAVPCALIINELVTNAIQHAFVDRDEGRITLCLRDGAETETTEAATENRAIVLQVSDDGRGLPDSLDLDTAQSLGFNLIRILTQQLHGTVHGRSAGGRTVFEVVFPA